MEQAKGGFIQAVVFAEYGRFAHAAGDHMDVAYGFIFFVKCFGKSRNHLLGAKADAERAARYDSDEEFNLQRIHLLPGRPEDSLLVGAGGYFRNVFIDACHLGKGQPGRDHLFTSALNFMPLLFHGCRWILYGGLTWFKNLFIVDFAELSGAGRIGSAAHNGSLFGEGWKRSFS